MISAVSGVPRTRAAKLRNPGIPPAGVSLLRDLEGYRVAEALPKTVAAHPGSGPAFSRILYVIASQGLVRGAVMLCQPMPRKSRSIRSYSARLRPASGRVGFRREQPEERKPPGSIYLPLIIDGRSNSGLTRARTRPTARRLRQQVRKAAKRCLVMPHSRDLPPVAVDERLECPGWVVVLEQHRANLRVLEYLLARNGEEIAMLVLRPQRIRRDDQPKLDEPRLRDDKLNLEHIGQATEPDQQLVAHSLAAIDEPMHLQVELLPYSIKFVALQIGHGGHHRAKLGMAVLGMIRFYDSRVVLWLGQPTLRRI